MVKESSDVQLDDKFRAAGRADFVSSRPSELGAIRAVARALNRAAAAYQEGWGRAEAAQRAAELAAELGPDHPLMKAVAFWRGTGGLTHTGGEQNADAQ